MSAPFLPIHGIEVDPNLCAFIDQEVLPGTGVTSDQFWVGFDQIVAEFAPQNAALLAERDRLQAELDQWHRAQPGPIRDPKAYRKFLTDIGYLVADPGRVQASTSNVDDELAVQAGPQLVVPVLNARYTLNAANARWGSLYDALYGTDAISESDGCEKSERYNPKRGAKVMAFARDFLDQAAPLASGSHKDAVAYAIEAGQLVVSLRGGQSVGLQNPDQLIGYQGLIPEPHAVLLRHNGLHFEIVIDHQSPIGSVDPAGVADVILEAALSTILDLEDSVAVVDTEDKLLGYRNFLGVIKGSLTERVPKNGRTILRGLNPDRQYTKPSGGELTLPGRSLLFIRNMGLLTSHPAVRFRAHNGQCADIPEGILDAVVTVAIGIHDLKAAGRLPSGDAIRNSRSGSIYVVKPKLHGPKEVAFSAALFAKIESVLGLPKNTVKLGVMDEERRTSVNLKACIAAAESRIAFINTGFLDRTGDEIHTSMLAGPMIRKADMKASKWIAAYERNNVLVGLACGLRGKAQIGKGMWAMPDRMAAMLEQKLVHPKAGANTAWVPSPTAATLHALHYHQVSVSSIQEEMESIDLAKESEDLLGGLLTVPIAENTNWSPAEKQQELDNNIQGILGYVVRWIDQGVGCSKVPDINDVGLMEDRATLRISSQHVANWLVHGIVSEADVKASFERMAAVVDAQNGADPFYTPMLPNLSGSKAFQAACDLVFKGTKQPSGYTEPLLNLWRLAKKKQAS
ncbi:MAG: hypothetical protein RL617_274 [Pseudomonadota bacterium]